ncbi:MAG: hypothetical protein Q9223_005137 [Gallowayella weberi]
MHEGHGGHDALRIWTSHLANWTLEDPSEMMDEDLISQIRRAEELWDIFCKSMLDFLDHQVSDPMWAPSEAIENFVRVETRPIMEYLSSGTVYNFAHAYMIQGWRPESYHIEFINEFFREPYEELLAHLRTMDAEDDTDWRIFQAFQAPSFPLVEYRNRLEQCRIKLAQRARAAESTNWFTSLIARMGLGFLIR